MLMFFYSNHAESGGYSVSEELSGHGIGREFHSLPLIYHHRNVIVYQKKI